MRDNVSGSLVMIGTKAIVERFDRMVEFSQGSLEGELAMLRVKMQVLDV